MTAALAAASTLVAAAFALSTLDRWLRRQAPHELAWSASLAMFAAGAAALWWAQASGWTPASFRLFYLAGAVLNVPWLALGTVYLLGGRRRGDQVRQWLLVLSGLAAGVVLFAPTRHTIAGGELPAGKDVFGVAPRVLAAVGSGVAALVIIAGAAWSAVRRRGQRRLVTANLVIVAGTMILSASGALAGRVGKDRAFALTLLAGVAVLFAGFLIADSRRPALEKRATQQLAADVAR